MIISLKNIKLFAVVIQMKYVLCEVRTKFLYIV
jgi:hypothetical protein